MGKLLWRLTPILVIVFSLRNGATQARKTWADLKNYANSAVCRLHMSKISSAVLDHYRSKQALPDNYEFPAWIRDRLSARGRDVSKDPFGNTYDLQALDDGFSLRSAGPDGELGTDDDIEQRFEGLRRASLDYQ